MMISRESLSNSSSASKLKNDTYSTGTQASSTGFDMIHN